MTAVIYARYSSDNQREESIKGQIRECTAYAEKNGITVIKHYIDRALSAKTDNRPDFQQMIKDSEKRLFDIVLVWKLDRFARNHPHKKYSWFPSNSPYRLYFDNSCSDISLKCQRLNINGCKVIVT